MKPLDNNILKVIHIDYLLVLPVHGLVEQVKAVTEVKIISLSPSIFESGVLLQKVMVPHLHDGSEALHKGIQIAIITIIPHP